ncbi:MAG: SPOR domain-containing protein, partial [Desulfobacteraceae bacterium]|nr:SPOR domain-containing protein [Desulfobacteraceae bacterium]
RIAVHCRLNPLTPQETAAYVSRRLSVAGNKGQVSFSHSATKLIHKRSGGIPRLINKICDFTLTAGYVNDAPVLGPTHVNRALAELPDLDIRGARKSVPLRHFGLPVAAMLLLALFAAVVWALHPENQPPATPAQPRHAAIKETAGPAPGPPPSDSSGVCLIPSPVEPTAGEAAAGDITAVVTCTTGGIPPVPVEKKQVLPHPSPPATYALQLGSFRTVARARRSVAEYRKKAIPAHWQAVEAGQWYRVVAGKFSNRNQAVRYRDAHQLKEARVIQAPWTVRVLPKRPDLSDTEILRFISEIGFDSLMETGIAGDNEIYTGLFESVEDAAITAERINSSGQILAQVVTR